MNVLVALAVFVVFDAAVSVLPVPVCECFPVSEASEAVLVTVTVPVFCEVLSTVVCVESVAVFEEDESFANGNVNKASVTK